MICEDKLHCTLGIMGIDLQGTQWTTLFDGASRTKEQTLIDVSMPIYTQTDEWKHLLYQWHQRGQSSECGAEPIPAW